MKKQHLTNMMILSILGSSAYGLLRFPKEVSQSIQQGLALCLDTLLPSLFPFFILSSLIVRLGVGQTIGRFFAPVMGPLFHLPGHCASPFVLGLLGGYPTGAKTTVSMYQDGQCSKAEAERMLSFCVNCGPSFTVGAVGYRLFGSADYGFLLAGVHLLAAVTTGVIMNRCQSFTPSPHQYTSSSSQPFCRAFVDSVTGSLRIFIDLCSFVICFSAITRLLSVSGMTNILSGIISPLIPGSNAEAFINGLLEMTQGVMQLEHGNITGRLIMSAGLLGWGGLSVHCQILAMLQDTDLSPKSYFKGKLLHSLLSVAWMGAILFNLEIVCLLAGGALLFLPCKTAKKEVEKPTHILYNERRKIREL